MTWGRGYRQGCRGGQRDGGVEGDKSVKGDRGENRDIGEEGEKCVCGRCVGGYRGIEGVI